MLPSEGKDKTKANLNELEKIEELSGKMSQNMDKDKKLMNQVLDSDKETIEDGKLVNDAINRGHGSFMPDMMFQNITKNFSMAKNLYGETILRALTGYSNEYLKKNINIPEFKRELKKDIEKNVQQLKDKEILSKDNTISDLGYNLASLVLYTSELDNLLPQGIKGERFNKRKSHYGDKGEVTNYSKGKRYRDIAIKKTIKMAVRRNHQKIEREDLRFFDRKSKGLIYLIYAIDSSGSMKGKKIEMAKKAGIALSFKATEEKDKVGLVVFGADIKEKIEPTRDFWKLLKTITKIQTGKETNIKETIQNATLMFPSEEATKHLILITDAMPNIGKEPITETINAAADATSYGITISLIGINLDTEGEELAKKIVEAGNGKLYTCRETEQVDQVILEDYYNL